ncbi:uncharacterized protein LOC127750975 [Frankliniella occidentalis]|uniref:Uncharacterized protein LOC127750975 n=1 Tax=Frankliniella occidentalis TaxID=133901 RepID=A0A9C6X615_FRAOC|nr:uncharacterized protein LOC127750975 [Frankliniella occidentalis]
MPRTTLWRLESSFNKIDRVGVPPPGINNDNGDQNVPPPENQESESERGDSIPELDDEVIVDSIGSAHEEFGSSEENNTDSASQTNSDTGVALQSRDSHLVRSIIHTSAKPSSRQTNVSISEVDISEEESTTGDSMSELDQIIDSSIAEETNSGNSSTHESSTISEVDISEEESYLNSNSRSYSEDGDSDSTHTVRILSGFILIS